MGRIADKIKHAWNAFREGDDSNYYEPENIGPATYGSLATRGRLRYSNERSIVAAIYTRIAIDLATISMVHARKDDQDRFSSVIKSGLNNCLTVEANIDQGARAFKQDIAMTLFEEGVAAIVPVDTTIDPYVSGGFDVGTLRVGTVTAWYPRHVKVKLYNEKTARKQEVILEKRFVAIVENPLYSVMNEPSSTLQRLISKLNMLDAVDEAASSGRLDMIIQLPYVIKSEARRQQAEQRRTDIEFQLKGSKYGIAYTDGTEKITQLNRPAENNLLKQIEFLTQMLYGQLGITEEVMNGTANEQAMLNYYNRTVEPLVGAIVEAMNRTLLTKTARTQQQAVMYFRDPFKLVPVQTLAEVADKFTRNEILSSNEVRVLVGFQPSKDPKADELRNSNMPAEQTNPPAPNTLGDGRQNGS